MTARKLATATYPIQFLLVDNTDHVTGKTGLSPAVTISKNGGTFAPPVGAVTELGNGFYSLAGSALDRSVLGELIIHAYADGADPMDIIVDVVDYDPFADIAIMHSVVNLIYTNMGDVNTVADAVWDEALSGHATAGTAGKKLTDNT